MLPWILWSNCSKQISTQSEYSDASVPVEPPAMTDMVISSGG